MCSFTLSTWAPPPDIPACMLNRRNADRLAAKKYPKMNTKKPITT